MPITLANRVKETSLTSGSGTISLNGASAGYQAFSGVLSSGDTTYYTITNSDAWEVGIGTFGSATLTRDTILSSSNSNAKINLSGESTVFVAYPSEKSVYKDADDKVVVGSSGIILSVGTPSSTANTLYVTSSGTLFFNGSGVGGGGGGGTTYTAGTGLVLVGDEFNIDSTVVQSGDNISLLVNNSGYLNAHPTIAGASSSDNSGRTYVQDILLDSNGHVTGIATATETVTDTNTTYTANTGLVLVGTEFNITADVLQSGDNISLLVNNSNYTASGDNISKFVNDSGYLNAHPSISAASSSDNSGQNFVQDILLDSNGHVTGIAVAAASGTGSGISNVVEDTTPQLGGDLDVNGNAIQYTFDLTGSASPNYTFAGSNNFFNSTANDPTLYLTRGVKYDFTNVPGSHPLRIQSVNGAGGSLYSIGVTNNGGTGTVSFTPPMDAPDELYYYCANHSSMNGTIRIIGSDSDTTYTAGTGLALVGTEFNISGVNTTLLTGTITNSQLAGSIANDKLSNSAVTINAGTGLTNGGSVSLGGSVNIDIDNTVIQSGDNISLLVNNSGYLNAHPSISAASSSDNSGQDFIQDILLDSNGHVTGIATGTASGGGGGGLDNVVEDTTPQLGGNLDLNSSSITGVGDIKIDGDIHASGEFRTAWESAANYFGISTSSSVKRLVSPNSDIRIVGGGTQDTRNNIQVTNLDGIKIEGGSTTPTDITINTRHASGNIIVPTGNIGVNTDNPQSKLDVSGVITASGGSSTQWNTAYGWGDHSSQNYVASGNNISLLVNNSGYLNAHPNISAASSSDNSGRTYVQDVLLDSNGHVTGIATATETVTDTNTTYTAGSGLTLNGTTFDANVAATVQTEAPQAVTTSSSRSYSVQVDSNDNLVVNVPWTTGVGGGGISNIVEDTSPQLGGGLDLNSSSITGVGSLDISGSGSLSGLSLASGVTTYATFELDGGDLLINVDDANAVSTSDRIQFNIDGTRCVALTSPSGYDTTTIYQKLYITTNGQNNNTFGYTENTFNESTNNIDFRIAGASDSNAFFLDASANSVGIGTNAPQTKLDVSGVITASGGASSQWNTAYGWGDHSSQNYLSSGDNISLLVNNSGYINAETNDLSSVVTWANVPDANITQSSVVQHSGALEITESQIVDLQSYLTAHPNISAASSSDNAGRTYIQDLLLDSNGHVTGIATATETVTDTDTTYTAGTGLSLSGTEFNIDATVMQSGDNISLLVNNSGYTNGAGVANYVTKWSTTDTLTSSVIYDNGTNVGIGTTSPALQSAGKGLHIHATGNHAEIKFTNAVTNATATDGVALVSSSSSFTINNREAGAMSLNTNNTNAIYIDSAQRVGLGNQSPGCVLDVTGTGCFTALKIKDQYIFPTGDGTAGHSLVTDGAGNIVFSGVSGGGGGGLDNIVEDTTPQLGGDLDLVSNSITGVGDVNITGTGTFTYVDGTCGLIVQDTGGSGIHIGDCAYSAGAVYAGIKHSNHTADDEYIMISDGTHTFISASSGNATIIRGGANNAKCEIRVYDNGDGQNGVVINEGGYDRDTRIEGDGDQNLFKVDASTDRVGIGINAPAYKFDVAGSGSFDALNINDQFTFPTGDGTAGHSLVTDGAGSIVFSGVSGGGGGGLDNVVEDTSPQLGGNLDLNSKNITGTGHIDITGSGNFTHVEVSGNIEYHASKPAITTDSDGATITFNMDTSDTHTVVLGGNRTLALSNTDAGQKFIIRLTQDGTGSRTVNWFSTIKWPGGLVPTLTTTASKTDVFGFICTSAGNYDGFVIGYNL